jgi:hypothetical protein
VACPPGKSPVMRGFSLPEALSIAQLFIQKIL